MYDSSTSRNTPNGALGSAAPRHTPPRRRRRRGGSRRNAAWIVALVATAPVIVFGLRLAHAAPAHLAITADIQGLDSGHGWGHGGYPMMPGSHEAAGLGPDNAAAMTSVNWAGYAATAQTQGSFTSVSASWSEPAVTCQQRGQTFSAFWAGLDGDGTPTVEQTGTEADCANGTATYQGWYELFPNAPVFFDNPVQPGDQLSASVVADGNAVFTLTLIDATQGWKQSIQQSAPDAELGSAEIIAEAPSDGQQILPLSDFGAINFTNVSINGQSLGAAPNLTSIAMGSNAVTLASPSAVSNDTAFTVTEATTPTPVPTPSTPAQGTGGQGSGGQGSGGQGSGGQGSGGQGGGQGSGGQGGGQGGGGYGGGGQGSGGQGSGQDGWQNSYGYGGYGSYGSWGS
jgi:hypothetical protein